MYLSIIYIHALYIFFFFFFNDTATTEIYTLSLHDALPISRRDACRGRSSSRRPRRSSTVSATAGSPRTALGSRDRKSTRLNSSHSQISYAVFCLKKKKKNKRKKQNREIKQVKTESK